MFHGKDDETGEEYSAVLEVDYVEVDSQIKRETVDLFMQQKNRSFSINNEDRNRMFKDMYLDYGDRNITHVMRVRMIRRNKYERVIAYDEDDREFILNMKWCENHFTATNGNLMFLQRIKSTDEGVKIRCPDGDVRSHVNDENYFPTVGPKIKYIQVNLMAFRLFSLASALHAIGDFKMDNIIRNKYEENIVQDPNVTLSYLNEVMRGTKGYCDSKGVKYYVSHNMNIDQFSYFWLVNNISD